MRQALYGGNASDAVLVVGGVHVSNLTVILDYGFTAVLLFMAARSFTKVADDTSNQLRLVFQVIQGLCRHCAWPLHKTTVVPDVLARMAGASTGCQSRN